MDEGTTVLYVGGYGSTEPRDHLEAAGFEVESVVGAADARAALRENRSIEVCVTRYEVPRADGIEFQGGLAVVDVVEAERPSLPVILFTRMANRDVAREVSGRDLFDYIPIQSGDAPYDRLVRRTRTAARRYRTDRRVEQLSRINEIVRDVNRELVRADDREAVERAVCEELTQRGAYEFARFEGGDGTTAHGDEADGGTIDPDALASHLGESGPGVVDLDERWQPYTAGIVVPVAIDGVEYGRVLLCTTRPDALDETEQEVLGELGETIADALDAIETQQQLAVRERELAEQNRRLERFASIASHDLRNPLQVADGYVQQLREESDDERLDEISQALGRIGTIIDDVLALARSGDGAMTKTAVDLTAAVERAWETVDTGDATLECAVSGTVQADEDRLARLFENLFRNAMEHGFTASTTRDRRAGGTDTDLTVRVVPAENGFAVEDDGVGIPREKRESVVELGHSEGGGTGLGLAIVARIAEAHDWTVTVEESDAGGARFVFAVGEPVSDA
ncbi:histidine kinase [Halomicrobium mukohataei]|uniref:histidine kinase n=1 Tax=Halomicrobium mukohataei TaxID=57705 RepID=A0A847U643_9EURY|nr:hybrid sensor histidine kinase/response regulator [Halomicrobium mukohataei]NLV08479.1 histidine kinase [Halomicrobium mukohataei]